MWAGRSPLLTWVSWNEESKRIPWPFLKAGSTSAELTWPLLLAPGVLHSPWVPSCSTPLWDTGTAGSPLTSLTHPLCWGPLTRTWAPWCPGPVTLICMSACQPEKRTGALLYTAPLQFHMDGASALPVDGVCGPGQIRAWDPPSLPPHYSLSLAWLGSGRRKQVTSRLAIKYQAGWSDSGIH